MTFISGSDSYILLVKNGKLNILLFAEKVINITQLKLQVIKLPQLWWTFSTF